MNLNIWVDKDTRQGNLAKMNVFEILETNGIDSSVGS
jgi:hypothetical protein